MISYIFLVIIGFVFLVKGADFLVEGSSSIAKKFRIPDIVIGLTIVSIGTSMPELFVSITSSLHNSSDLSVGNVIGSNICNLLLILGATAIIKDIKFSRNTMFIEIPFLILTNIILFILAQDRIISQKESCALLLLFIAFITYNYLQAKNESPFDTSSPSQNISIIKNIFKIVIGIVALKYGGEFVVDNSKNIAKFFNVSDKIIGCTIVAIGTSLPEFVTSVISALKGNTDLALGNIIGSNLFNILIVLGISSFINTIYFNLSYNTDIILLYCASLLLFIFPHIFKKNCMSKSEGFIFLTTYIGYILITILN